MLTAKQQLLSDTPNCVQVLFWYELGAIAVSGLIYLGRCIVFLVAHYGIFIQTCAVVKYESSCWNVTGNGRNGAETSCISPEVVVVAF